MAKKISIIILFLVFLCSQAFAETIILKSGKTVEGKILEKTDEYIKIDIGVGIPITYFLDEIENVDVKTLLPTKETVTASATPEKSTGIYVEEEYGINLVFPEEWFIVSGKQKREEMKKELDEKFSSIDLTQSAQGKSGGKVCPLAANPAKLLGNMKNVMLAMYPLVIAYKYNPDEQDIAFNPNIQLFIGEVDEYNSLETEKLELQLGVKYSKGNIIEPIEDIVINYVKGIKMAYELRRGLNSYAELVCVFVKENKQYTLSFLCNAEVFRNYRADFEKVINSFQLK